MRALSRTTGPAQYAAAEADGAAWLRAHRPDAASVILGDSGRVQAWRPQTAPREPLGGTYGAGHGP